MVCLRNLSIKTVHKGDDNDDDGDDNNNNNNNNKITASHSFTLSVFPTSLLVGAGTS